MQLYEYSKLLNTPFTQYLHWSLWKHKGRIIICCRSSQDSQILADWLVWSIYWSIIVDEFFSSTFLVKLDIITSLMLICRFNQLSVFVVFLNICCHHCLFFRSTSFISVLWSRSVAVFEPLHTNYYYTTDEDDDEDETDYTNDDDDLSSKTWLILFKV